MEKRTLLNIVTGLHSTFYFFLFYDTIAKWYVDVGQCLQLFIPFIFVPRQQAESTFPRCFGALFIILFAISNRWMSLKWPINMFRK